MLDLQYQLTQTGVDETLEGLAFTENTITTCALATFRKCGRVQQSIDFIEAAWNRDDDAKINTNNRIQVYTTTYSRFQSH